MAALLLMLIIMLKGSDQYKNVDITSIFQRLDSSITHLYLFIDRENKNMKINFEQFSHCLTHLTLHFVEGKTKMDKFYFYLLLNCQYCCIISIS